MNDKFPHSRQRSKSWPKVFVGPLEISGITSGIALALRSQGGDVDLVLKTKHPFGYDCADDKDFFLWKLWRRAGRLRAQTSRQQLLKKMMVVLLDSISGALVLGHALFRYQAFIFVFGQTITNSTFELKLLRLLRKRLVFVFCGSDSRPPYIDGGYNLAGRKIDTAHLVYLAAQQKAKLLKIEKYSDICVNNPFSAQFHEKSYINWFCVGIPKVHRPETTPCRKKEQSSIIKVLHSPSNRAAKGTDKIVSAIERLRSKGHSIELILIENSPNEKVLEELSSCDLVVDQLYSDTPLAGFATEAATFGKPAVVAGYFSTTMQEVLRPEDIPPSLVVHPDDIELAIERLVLDSEYRYELGKKAREFVERRWSLEEVGGRYLKLINAEIPAEWWLDPGDIKYVNGWGISEPQARATVRHVIELFGKDALKLGKNPALEKAFQEFAYSPVDVWH